MIVVLGLLIALWLLVVWAVALALIGVVVVCLAIVVWCVLWAVVGFLVRLAVALVLGPERRRA